MARKLQPDEAEVFTGAMNGLIPTDPEAFLQSLLDQQEDPLELTLVPGLWLKGSSPGPASS